MLNNFALFCFMQEIRREDFMFKLVGDERFSIGKVNCVIHIDAVSGFSYEYVLEVNGKKLHKFIENQSKIMKCWLFPSNNQIVRVVLGAAL